MKTLSEIYDPSTSDKGTNHSYIENVYSKLFQEYRNSAKLLLEIGVYEGGSLYMWKEYFTDAIIYGIDPFKRVEISDTRIIQLTVDAYDPSTLASLPDEFDIIIDDGPHTGDSQKRCIDLYFPLVKKGGLLIIEDIASDETLAGLINSIPSSTEYEIFDLRSIKNRWDDLVLVIKK